MMSLMKWQKLTARMMAKTVPSALAGRVCMLVSVKACPRSKCLSVYAGALRLASIKSMMQSG